MRHALAVWQVNTVVIATDPARPPARAGPRPRLRGGLHDGRPRPPAHLQAGAWVWNDVQLRLDGPLVVKPGTLATCTGAAEGNPVVFRATLLVTECVAGGALSAP